MKTSASIAAIMATLASQSLAAGLQGVGLNGQGDWAFCKTEADGPQGVTHFYQNGDNGWVQARSNWIDLDLYSPDGEEFEGQFTLAIYESEGVSDCMNATEEAWKVESFYAEDNGSHRYLNAR